MHGFHLLKLLEDKNIRFIIDTEIECEGQTIYDKNEPVICCNTALKILKLAQEDRCILPDHAEYFLSGIYNEIMIHEGFHVYQLLTDPTLLRFNQSFEDAIINYFALEAGAISFSAMVQYEMLLNGGSCNFCFRQENKSFSKAHMA